MTGKLKNNFSDKSDPALVAESLSGERLALEELIRRHSDWIYNISFKMVMDHDEAADITQEILIKVITNLSGYNALRGSFRTWIYRITANHIFHMKKRRMEERFTDLDTYFSLIESIPDNRPISRPDSGLIEEDIRISCMAGMLVCLNRSERLVFILGGIFGITDVTGSDITGFSRANFRKILSRARKKVHSHMHGLCGHVNPESPCRCSGKMKAFLDSGRVDPFNLKYNRTSCPTVREELKTKFAEFSENFRDPFFEIFRKDPFYNAPDMTAWLRSTLEDDRFKKIFSIN